ncbi:anthranilate phosphoribosyltransferase [Aquabacterium sp. CECT 9606]|uniref:anthranilate phosphoribosyltransferase n=1 Tax=Aquabacterium sp. CECT 9606 TaxID=2845822 RepID=UPI001E401703|nr:anthranilate phosphoribosyltransferase [Aquabacterium sp. CECT 9606]CAH0354894.1 Anthranilate phosphoribosyltransferase [Aquabacterium sp. CECT 9606]
MEADVDVKAAIQAVVARRDLPPHTMQQVMRQVLGGQASPAQIGALLVGLRMKGESVGELTAAAQVMRAFARGLRTEHPHLVDTCGTGGDGAHIFNVSTACAFVAAAGGAVVAKHGNRSISSRSGSADLLEAAGARLDLPDASLSACLQEMGIAFLFAPTHHPAMAQVAGPRRELGGRSLFNLLGPLSNPAGARRQVIGVFDAAWLSPMAEVLRELGSEHVMVVHAQDGLDEISVAVATDVVELRDGSLHRYRIAPETFGMPRSLLSTLVVDGAPDSLRIIREVFANRPGPARDIVVLNAGAALYVAGIEPTLEAGVHRADQLVADGSAGLRFDAFIQFTQRVTPS